MSCFHSLQVAATNKIDLTESSKSLLRLRKAIGSGLGLACIRSGASHS